MHTEEKPEELDLIWGAENIGKFLSVSQRRAFHLLESKAIPARKLAGRWVARRHELENFFVNDNVIGRTSTVEHKEKNV